MTRLILDWLEVWAPLIPIVVWARYKTPWSAIGPTPLYFILAVIMATIANIMWKAYVNWISMADGGNGIVYNIHSIVRTLLLLAFMMRMHAGRTRTLILLLGITYCIGAIYVFTEKSIFNISSKALALESIILIVAGLLYLFKLLTQDKPISVSKDPSFWITIGILTFEASNFTIFLSYTMLMDVAKNFAWSLWDWSNFFYLLFCLLSARGYYAGRNR